MNTQKLVSLLAISAMLGASYGFDDYRPRYQRPKRPCIVCGTLHDHNNAFCSAECCKAYKKKEV